MLEHSKAWAKSGECGFLILALQSVFESKKATYIHKCWTSYVDVWHIISTITTFRFKTYDKVFANFNELLKQTLDRTWVLT